MPEFSAERTAATSLVRTGGAILLAPDPTPINEVVGVTMIIGGAAWHLAQHLSTPSSGGITYPDTASHPVLTSASGHTKPRGKNHVKNNYVKKQMSSTSQSYSNFRRKKYDYARKRKYY